VRDTASERPVPAVPPAAVLRLLFAAGIALAAWLVVAVVSAGAAHAEESGPSGSGWTNTTAPAPDAGEQTEDTADSVPDTGTEVPQPGVPESNVPEGGSPTPPATELPDSPDNTVPESGSSEIEPPAGPAPTPFTETPAPESDSESEAAEGTSAPQAHLFRERVRETRQSQVEQFQTFQREAPEGIRHRVPAFAPQAQPEHEMLLPGFIGGSLHGLMDSVHGVVGDLESDVLPITRQMPEWLGVPDFESRAPALPEMPQLPEFGGLPEVMPPGGGNGSSIQIAPVDADAVAPPPRPATPLVGSSTAAEPAPAESGGITDAARYTVASALRGAERSVPAGFAHTAADDDDTRAAGGGGGGSTGGQPPTPPSAPGAPASSVQHAQDQSGANRQPLAALATEHTTTQLRLIGTSRDHAVAGAGRQAALPTTSPD
jgi:hypothetical protein